MNRPKKVPKHIKAMEAIFLVSVVFFIIAWLAIAGTIFYHHVLKPGVQHHYRPSTGSSSTPNQQPTVNG